MNRNSNKNIELVLFENSAISAKHHLSWGLSQFMVDMEVEGKDLRQLGFDTEIRPGTLEDIREISAIPAATVWVRLNRFDKHSAEEIELAIKAGANVLILPMVTSVKEVEKFISLVNLRCKVGIMIETPQAVSIASLFNPLSIEYAFFGLNDFTISRGGGTIFKALVDGTVQHVRKAIPDVRFGVAGLTDIRRGYPIPCKRIVEELSRLECDFTFLRRSFTKDSFDIHPSEIIRRINAYWDQCSQRTSSECQNDHELLKKLVNEI